MTYNTHDTIYYKSAKKLLGYGRKILSAGKSLKYAIESLAKWVRLNVWILYNQYNFIERILPLRGHLPFITTISIDEFGFDINDSPSGDTSSGNYKADSIGILQLNTVTE